MLYCMLNDREKVLTRDYISVPRSRADERAHIRQTINDLRQAVSMSWSNNFWILRNEDAALIRSGMDWELYQIAKVLGLRVLCYHRRGGL